jgi:hydrogenase expression/formation protein HypE
MAEFTPACPLPITDYRHVLMAHGGGGRLMRNLIEQMFARAFRPQSDTDSAVLSAPGTRLAFTTDSFVVRPLFFPGGDIGSLAVHGTVNDLAMSGATPHYLAAGFILEEGLPFETLWRIVQSMAAAAEAAGVRIVTGDTKVVERGHADGLYINTSGIGFFEHDLVMEPRAVRPGDAIVVSGDIARHGMAILSAREGLEFESAITSDSAAVNGEVAALWRAGLELHCLRDLTRGGLATALVEIAGSAGLEFEIDEPLVEVREDVRAACEILGFDPLYVANEGRFVAFLPASQCARALKLLPAARRIGTVDDGPAGVVARSALGGTRILDLLSGEQLPRIC